MAQSWITEVSMELDAETPKPPAPPIPPPPPPDPPTPSAVQAGAQISYAAAPPGPTGGGPNGIMPPGAAAFYQDPYSSFSQYGAAQQYADPQASQWAGYYPGYNYNSGHPQQYQAYPPTPSYQGYVQDAQQQQFGQQAYAQQWPGYATAVPQPPPVAPQAYPAQAPYLQGQPYLPTPEIAQPPVPAQAPGIAAPLPPPPPPPPPNAGEQQETRALDQRPSATHKSEAPAGLVTSQEVPQPQTTRNGSHRGSPDLAISSSVPPAPKEAEPRTEEPGDDGAWPSSLRRYLQRAFDKCDRKQGSRQHAQLEKALHRKVTDAMAENAMLTKDWDNEPLPSLVASKRERSPSRGAGRNRQGEKNKKRNHDQIEARAATPRKGRGSLSRMPQADQRRLSNRLERFDLGMRPPPSSSSRSGNDLAFQSKPMVDDNGMVDWAAITIKGTSTKLEKDYLRLTQPPDPASVRPQSVLEKSLENISAKWAKGGLDYIFACSQLKAIRQDCVVQRIKNAFTVQVYEGHARIALQQGDLNEYNQCQTQLQELYACGLEGSQEEFTAYRVLYYLYLQTSCSGGSTGLQKILQELPAGEQAPAINHALRVRKAVAMTDYHLFFSLYKTTPNLGQHIMQKLLKTMRVEALRRIIKAYRPTISLSFVLGELIFDTDEDGVAFLQACGVIFTPNGAEVACKESSVDASGLDADAPNSLL